MNNERILLHELVFLVTWLSAPVLILTIAAELVVFRRQGLLKRRGIGVVVIALMATVIGVIVLSVPLWAVLPYFTLPGVALPNGAHDFSPPFFLPSLIAAAVVAPLASWWAVRYSRRMPPNPALQGTRDEAARP